MATQVHLYRPSLEIAGHRGGSVSISLMFRKNNIRFSVNFNGASGLDSRRFIGGGGPLRLNFDIDAIRGWEARAVAVFGQENSLMLWSMDGRRIGEMDLPRTGAPNVLAGTGRFR